jgi:hypothetical protein
MALNEWVLIGTSEALPLKSCVPLPEQDLAGVIEPESELTLCVKRSDATKENLDRLFCLQVLRTIPIFPIRPDVRPYKQLEALDEAIIIGTVTHGASKIASHPCRLNAAEYRDTTVLNRDGAPANSVHCEAVVPIPAFQEERPICLSPLAI